MASIFGVGPANTAGTFPALNKQGVVADVVGTGALAHSQQTSGNLRLAYDVTPLVQATYSLGIWNNVQTSNPQTYLTSAVTGAPTFGGVSGFASNKYIWDQTHLSQRGFAQERYQGRSTTSTSRHRPIIICRISC